MTGVEFTKGVGDWAGVAEVFDGGGVFLGNAADQRRVQQLDAATVRIDVQFVGPLVMNGHYTIQDHGTHRLYQGPANVGYAEALGEGMVDANAYWAAWGLNQRVFIMITPDGQMQLSLALMSRGDQLMYTVVGENYRVTPERRPLPEQLIVGGTAYDRRGDPAAGRGGLLLHRPGVWHGTLRVLDGECGYTGECPYTETVTCTGEGSEAQVAHAIEGGAFAEAAHTCTMASSGWHAWSRPGDVVGSYNLCGGRAMSGIFHHVRAGLRAWRREVASCDGACKAVVEVVYRGGSRVGVQYGILAFTAA
jgi:hypothetical protein